MINAYCTTNDDDYKQEIWPTHFDCLPRVGDRVRAKSGKILHVACVTFGERDRKYIDNIEHPSTIPYVEIELYRKRCSTDFSFVKKYEKEKDPGFILIKLAEEFSDTPGGRFISDGPFSGELFRIDFLYPKIQEAIQTGKILWVDLDGTYGCPPGFLDEAFGGLVREYGLDYNMLRQRMMIMSRENMQYIVDVDKYMKESKPRKK